MKEDKIIIKIIMITALILVFGQYILYLLNYFNIGNVNHSFWSIVHIKTPSSTIVLYSIISIILTILVIIPKINKAILDKLKIVNNIKFKRKYLAYFITTSIFFVVFYIFRITNENIMKDHWGYIAEQALTEPSRLVFLSGPITAYINFIFFRISNVLWGWSAIKAVGLMHVIYGALIFFAILLMCDSFLKTNEFLKSNLQKILLILLLTTTGFAQFFFGWWEGTTAGTIWMVVFIYTSYLFLRKKLKFIYPVLAFWLAFFFHAIAFWYIPAVLFLYFVNAGITKLSFKNFFKGIFNIKFLKFILILLIPTIILFGILEITLYSRLGVHVTNIEQVKMGNLLGGGDGTIFVPLTGIHTVWEHFTMFSFGHFMEFLNLNLLNMPFGLTLFITLLLLYRKKINFKDPFIYFMLILISFFLLFMTTYNVDYIEEIIWDGYTTMILLYAIFNSYILIKYSQKGTFETVALIMIIVGLLLTIPWILSNSSYAFLLQ
ncbi:MAG: hypothetical protein KJ674_00500 [Nanoarchaeota archaeon]|nr:hypothetical protein [Nanoarchaeota archaeon]